MQWRSKKQEKHKQKQEWHDFFCLIPRLVDTEDGGEMWVWLETIERKGKYIWSIYDSGWNFLYRLKKKD